MMSFHSQSSARSNSSKQPSALTIAFKRSILAHFALFILILLKNIIQPAALKPYIPTLRVDLVGLPRSTPHELTQPQAQFKKEIAHLVKKIEQEAHRNQLRSDPSQVATTLSVNKRNIERKNIRALERLKSLAKLDTPSSTPIEGNFLSPGSSLAGDAKEAEHLTYYDQIRDHLKENWSLPTWMTKKNFNALVEIKINPHGQIATLRFRKSSGNPQFDQAVQRTIQNSAPMPPPPRDLQTSILFHGILVGFPL